MKYTEVTFDPLGRITLPSGQPINFNWGDFASARAPKPIPPTTLKEALKQIGRHNLASALTGPPKRRQRGGVPKGRIWAHVAAEQVHWGLQFNNQAGREARYRWFGLALNTIYQHSRDPETRSEALRLLAVVETRP